VREEDGLVNGEKEEVGGRGNICRVTLGGIKKRRGLVKGGGLLGKRGLRSLTFEG